MLSRLALFAGLATLAAAQGGADPADLAKSLGLTENFVYQFPDKPLDSSASDDYMFSNWHLNNDQIQFGAGDITFQPDPAGGKRRSLGQELLDRGEEETAAATTSAPTPRSTIESRALTNSKTSLRIEYPAGSYSNATGGTQFYSQPLNASSDTPKPADGASTNGQFERMLLSYDTFFPSDFE